MPGRRSPNQPQHAAATVPGEETRAAMLTTLLYLVPLWMAMAQSGHAQNQATQPLVGDFLRSHWSPVQLQNHTAQPVVSTILRARWSPSQVQNQMAQPLVSATSRPQWTLAQGQNQTVQTLVGATSRSRWLEVQNQTAHPPISETSKSHWSPAQAQNPMVQPPNSTISRSQLPLAASGRSYHTLPSNNELDNDVDSQKPSVAVGTAEYAPLTYNHDYYRNHYSGKYQPQEGDYKKTSVSSKQGEGGYKYGAKKRKEDAVDDYPTGPSPRDRLGFEDDDDYEDHEGGYGYGYVEEDGYYEHGDDYHRHHARPVHHGYHGPPVYVPHRHHHHGDKYLKFGILALLKLILAKLKAFGLFKLLLLFIIKPILLFKLALKFLFITKAFNALTLPLLLLPLLLLLLPLLLLPLLLPLAPLLLLPLLLPLLLLFLPVPVLTPGAGAGGAGRRRRRRRAAAVAPGSASPNLLMLTRQVLEADQCLERIACQLAARRSSLYNRFVIWILERFQRWVAPESTKPRLTSYLGAYRQGAEVPSQCRPRYECDSEVLGLPRGSLLQQLL
ncbi:uncharacterized protein LOC126335208 isoform X1 [Schistocerca gregaria]|uniref:uncharacterized protein LOC126335208 isoform X1 n=1 Tax=Schistocerca gregaria TaxID=7010 RepID=UPI00211DBA1A|nr:uncharacterized protein LOC126335208 isoform X1 [Schistocerca gregaria]